MADDSDTGVTSLLVGLILTTVIFSYKEDLHKDNILNVSTENLRTNHVILTAMVLLSTNNSM